MVVADVVKDEVSMAVADSYQASADAKGEIVGLKPGTVKVEVADVSILKTALKVELHIGCPTFEHSISPEDFGLTFESPESRAAFMRTVKLPKIYSMTFDKMSALSGHSTRARQVIKDKSSDTKHFGYLVKLGEATETREAGWNFIEVLEAVNNYGADYMAVAQSIYDEYPEIEKQLEEDYTLIAIDNYDRLKRANVHNLGTLSEEVERFVSTQMARIKGQREVLKSKFSWKLDVTDIPIHGALSKDAAAQIKATLAEQEQSFQAKIEAVKLETAERVLGDGLNTLFADLRSVTNGMLYSVSVKTLKAIQTNGYVPGGSVAGLKNLIERLQEIQLFPDESVDEKVARIKELLAAASVKGASVNDNVGAVNAIMKRIAIESKIMLLELDGELPKDVADVSTREFGVPETLAGLRRLPGFSREGTRDMALSAPVQQVTVDRTDDRSF